MIRVKKWESPDFSMMNLSKTTVSGCTCGSNGIYRTTYKNEHPDHYCHWLGEWHDNNCASLKDPKHGQNDKCNGQPHWKGSETIQNSKCCCGQRQAGGDITNPS